MEPVSANEEVRKLADRAIEVADRLLAHGLDEVKVEVEYNGRSRTDPERKGIQLTVNASPGITVVALEMLAESLDAERGSAFARGIEA